mmetsp:Transcript_71161/g.123451  ORF Transcript_71161/g.123451 Transcript_71161/m.123451 type:complete len:395 (+) Transcript_71161:670-1854(+)
MMVPSGYEASKPLGCEKPALAFFKPERYGFFGRSFFSSRMRKLTGIATLTPFTVKLSPLVSFSPSNFTGISMGTPPTVFVNEDCSFPLICETLEDRGTASDHPLTSNFSGWVSLPAAKPSGIFTGFPLTSTSIGESNSAPSFFRWETFASLPTEIWPRLLRRKLTGSENLTPFTFVFTPVVTVSPSICRGTSTVWSLMLKLKSDFSFAETESGLRSAGLSSESLKTFAEKGSVNSTRSSPKFNGYVTMPSGYENFTPFGSEYSLLVFLSSESFGLLAALSFLSSWTRKLKGTATLTPFTVRSKPVVTFPPSNFTGTETGTPFTSFVKEVFSCPLTLGRLATFTAACGLPSVRSSDASIVLGSLSPTCVAVPAPNPQCAQDEQSKRKTNVCIVQC